MWLWSLPHLHLTTIETPACQVDSKNSNSLCWIILPCCPIWTTGYEKEQKPEGATIESARPLYPLTRHCSHFWISDKCVFRIPCSRTQESNTGKPWSLPPTQSRSRQHDEEGPKSLLGPSGDLEEASLWHEYHTLYWTLCGLSSKSKSTKDNIKKADGTFLCSATERLRQGKEFFKGHYNHDLLQVFIFGSNRGEGTSQTSLSHVLPSPFCPPALSFQTMNVSLNPG